MRSLWLNFEISLFVYGTDFTGRLRALQDRYLRDSDRLELDRWRRRPARRRFLEDAFRLLGPLL
jgi:cardiolipin synthase